MSVKSGNHATTLIGTAFHMFTSSSMQIGKGNFGVLYGKAFEIKVVLKQNFVFIYMTKT